MSYVILFTAALVGPDGNPTADFWRGEFQSAMRVSAERAKPLPELVVPRLVKLFSRLESADVLPITERTRLRKSLESRLMKQLEELLREKLAFVHKRQRAESRSPGAILGGGGANFPAQPLIDLIVSTIASDSWVNRGGLGSISYYPQNPALVIRQSQRVHEEIADLLQALRGL